MTAYSTTAILSSISNVTLLAIPGFIFIIGGIFMISIKDGNPDAPLQGKTFVISGILILLVAICPCL